MSCYKTSGACQPFGLCWLLTLAKAKMKAAKWMAIGLLDFRPFLFQKGFHSNVSCYKTSGACQPFGLCWLLTLAKAKMKAAKWTMSICERNC